jgi:opacity protein-like surface antigen
MKRSTAVALLSMFLAPASGYAADLSSMPLTVPQSDAPGAMVEVGTNWYIRGDIGVGLENLPSLSYPNIGTALPGSALVNTQSVTNNSAATFNGGVGVGYKFNNYLRFDATYEYRTAPGLGVTSSGIVCPYSATVVNNAAGPAGYLYDPTQTCNSNLSVRQFNNVGMANAYVDLGDYYGFTPYVGAGAGLNANTITGSMAYTQAVNGAPYPGSPLGSVGIPNAWVNKTGALIAPQPAIPFDGQAWDRSINVTKYNFAFSIMAGVGYALGPNAILDIGYRYMNLGASTVNLNNPTGATIKTAGSSQDARIGIRYLLN